MLRHERFDYRNPKSRAPLSIEDELIESDIPREMDDDEIDM